MFFAVGNWYDILSPEGTRRPVRVVRGSLSKQIPVPLQRSEGTVSRYSSCSIPVLSPLLNGYKNTLEVLILAATECDHLFRMYIF